MSKGKRVYRNVHLTHPDTQMSHVFGPGMPDGDRLPDWASDLVDNEKVFTPFAEEDEDYPVNEATWPEVDSEQVVDGSTVGPLGDAPENAGEVPIRGEGEKAPAKKAPVKKASSSRSTAKKATSSRTPAKKAAAKTSTSTQEKGPTQKADEATSGS